MMPNFSVEELRNFCLKGKLIPGGTPKLTPRLKRGGAFQIISSHFL